MRFSLLLALALGLVGCPSKHIPYAPAAASIVAMTPEEAKNVIRRALAMQPHPYTPVEVDVTDERFVTSRDFRRRRASIATSSLPGSTHPGSGSSGSGDLTEGWVTVRG